MKRRECGVSETLAMKRREYGVSETLTIRLKLSQ